MLYVADECYRRCNMDQLFCRRLDNHRFVACWHHIHTPEEHPANNKDRPEIRHVSGKTLIKHMCTLLDKD